MRLRRVREDDLPVIERLWSDPEQMGPFLWRGWSDPGRFRRRWHENGMLGGDGGNLMVVEGDEDNADGAVLGYASWRKVPTTAASFCWSIGIVLLPEARGRGAGSRAQRLLVSYLFAHTEVHRVQAETDVANRAEQRALEKAGFTREGVMRGFAFRDGGYRDTVLYGVLRGEHHPATPG